MGEKKRSQGFGDDFEKVAKAMRLDKVANQVASAMGKEDCGCKKRKEALNKMFPYKNKEQKDGSN